MSEHKARVFCEWCAERNLEGFIIDGRLWTQEQLADGDFLPYDPRTGQPRRGYPVVRGLQGRYEFTVHVCHECFAPVREGLVVCAGLSECWRRYVEREREREKKNLERLAECARRSLPPDTV